MQIHTNKQRYCVEPGCRVESVGKNNYRCEFHTRQYYSPYWFRGELSPELTSDKSCLTE